jgi:hypothetical protein
MARHCVGFFLSAFFAVLTRCCGLLFRSLAATASGAKRDCHLAGIWVLCAAHLAALAKISFKSLLSFSSATSTAMDLNSSLRLVFCIWFSVCPALLGSTYGAGSRNLCVCEFLLFGDPAAQQAREFLAA